jgi:hypothetical protein
VSDLLADPATRASVDEADLPLLKCLTQLCQEFAYHGQTVLEEPGLEFVLRRDDDEHQYRLWFLYPPSFQRLNFYQLSRIFAFGRPFVDATGIILEIEPATEAPRLALTILVTMARSPVVAETKETITVATSVVYHAASTLGANTPGGLKVGKQQMGIVFNNSASPRTASNKRPRSDSTPPLPGAPPVKRVRADPPPGGPSVFE